MKFDLDSLKVLSAGSAGVGNWWLHVDVILKVAISLATLFYIVLKIKEQLEK